MTTPLTGASAPAGGHALAKVHVSGTLRDALRTIDLSGLEIALAVDDRERLVGILTDGDIRRLLLRDVSLDSPLAPHLQRHFERVAPTADRTGVLDVMQARTISQIPITDADGRLVGVHTLHSIIGAVPRPNAAVIMAGGRGQRLRPYTDDVPKPMLRVAGRPILERIVLHLVGYGISRIFVSVNYKAAAIEQHFGDGASLGCRIEYLRETQALGSGGALSLLADDVPAEPLLVLNGDLLTSFDVGSILAFHAEGGYRATVGVHEYTHTIPLGVAEIEGTKIARLREKPTELWHVNAGIYVLDADLIGRIPRDTYYGLPTLIDGCLDLGEPVGAFFVREDWIDVGHHRELRRARGQDE